MQIHPYVNDDLIVNWLNWKLLPRYQDNRTLLNQPKWCMLCIQICSFIAGVLLLLLLAICCNVRLMIRCPYHYHRPTKQMCVAATSCQPTKKFTLFVFICWTVVQLFGLLLALIVWQLFEEKTSHSLSAAERNVITCQINVNEDKITIVATMY